MLFNLHSGFECPHSGCFCCGGGGEGGGESLINIDSESCFPVLFRGELTYTVVLYAHTVVVYVDGGGGPLINMGP